MAPGNATKTILVNGITVFLLCIATIGGIAVDDFYPFGAENGDEVIPANDDGSSPEMFVSTLFPFFNHQHNSFWVNTNGVISFLAPVSQFTPDSLPVPNLRIIAPFWADVDTGNGGKVWYRETTNKTLLEKVTEEVRHNFGAKMQSFTGLWMFIATWESVAFYGASVLGRQRTNTFQVVLVTNGRHSFTIFNYAKVEWTTGTASNGDDDTGLGGTPAQVGFNLGDNRTFTSVNGSRTSNIINIVRKTNVGIPGKFIFQIDTEKPLGAGCNTAGTLTIVPRFGGMLGGDRILVSGPCFKLNSDKNQNKENQVVSRIKFEAGGQHEVDCYYVDSHTASCVTPHNVFMTGYVKVIMIRKDAEESPGSDFLGSFSFENVARIAADLVRDNMDNWHDLEFPLKLKWNAVNAKKKLQCPGEHVRFDLLLYSEVDGPTLRWQEHFVINNYYDINKEELLIHEGNMITETKVGLKTEVMGLIRMACENENYQTTVNNPTMWSDIHSVRWAINFQSNVKEIVSMCSIWIEEEKELQDLRTGMTPCPCLLRQAITDLGRFHPDPFCNQASSHPHNCKDYGNFHCVRSNSPPTDTGTTSGQLCCYGSDGELLKEPFANGKRSAGRSSRYNYLGKWPFNEKRKVPYLSHFLNDEVPYLYCCKYNKIMQLSQDKAAQQCEEFQKLRPSSDCQNPEYVPPRAARMTGDPHLVTLDGKRYTFNGIGEYTLLSTIDNSFLLQGRTEQAEDSTGQLQNASVFTAVAAQANGTDKVQVHLNEIVTSEILINGEVQDFDNQPSQEFTGVTIHSLKNQTEITVVFGDLEVAIQVDITPNLLLNVVFFGPDNLKNKTLGLLGNWNDQVTDDYTFPNGYILPQNETSRKIHQFGQAWMVNENSSLFTYPSGKTYSSYQQVHFQPAFSDEVIAATNITEEQARVCGESKECLYDLITTNNTVIAEKTKEVEVVFEEIILAFTKKVIRCPYLPTPSHGSKNVSGYKIGNVTFFSCREGYTLEGSTVRQCLNGGIWDGKNTMCKEIISQMEIPNLNDTGIGLWNMFGIIAGSVVGVVIIVAVVISCLLYKRREHNNKKMTRQTDAQQHDNAAYANVMDFLAENNVSKIPRAKRRDHQTISTRYNNNVYENVYI